MRVLNKFVDGVKVQLTAEESASVVAEWKQNAASASAVAYKRTREIAYPDIREQFDMLFHELETTGSLSISGSWFNTVKTVKDANPKP